MGTAIPGLGAHFLPAALPRKALSRGVAKSSAGDSYREAKRAVSFNSPRLDWIRKQAACPANLAPLDAVARLSADRLDRRGWPAGRYDAVVAAATGGIVTEETLENSIFLVEDRPYAVWEWGLAKTEPRILRGLNVVRQLR